MTTPTQTAAIVRMADPADISGMISLMEPFIATGDLLPRTPLDLIRDLHSYVIAVSARGRVVGSGSLRQFTHQLAEVQALAVDAGWQGAGVGSRIVEELLGIAGRLGIGEVFALTRRVDFFERLGFHVAEREQFPDKIWKDCSKCPRQHACDEIAVHRILSV